GTLNLNSLQISSPAGHGTVTINGDGTINYAPSSNFSGEDNFTYTVCDGEDAAACAIATVTIVVRPILMDLEKTVDKQNISLGDYLTYTITLINNSEFEVQDILIEDPLPENLLYVSSSLNPSGENVWEISELVPGGSITLSIDAMAVNPGKAINTVVAKAGDYQISDQSETVNIYSQVDLQISKSSMGAEIYQGNEFEYEIQVRNVGDSEALDVV